MTFRMGLHPPSSSSVNKEMSHILLDQQKYKRMISNYRQEMVQKCNESVADRIL